jgi:uncharacterized protein with ATP-grasp and redox domains
MEIFLDCLPCVLRQVLEASRMATDKPELHAKIMDESISILGNYRNYENSPGIVKDIHQVVKRLTGVSDPYKEIKKHSIHAAMKVYPFLVKYLYQKHNELYWALKIAATGNIMDSAIYHEINIEGSIEKELTKEFSICDISELEENLKTAKSILMIGDNAGETVFDRVLIESLAGCKVTYAARSEPVINDATIRDAFDSGLNTGSRIISTGCGAPGAVLDECGAEFLSAFYSADIVISKGQGNYEALSDCPRPVFFLLKAKCAMIAARLGVDLNDYVFKYQKTEGI